MGLDWEKYVSERNERIISEALGAGGTTREISERLGIPLGAVRNVLARGGVRKDRVHQRWYRVTG